MKKRKTIEKTIFNSIEEINHKFQNSQYLKKSSETVLYGKDGSLDSLGLVNLLVIIEQNIEDDFDVSINIADERAMSQKHSPFRTVETLADYIEMLLEEIKDPI